MRKLAAVLACLAAACGGGGGSTEPTVDLSLPIQVDLTKPMPERLSSFRFFTWDPASAEYTFHDGVIPYDLNTPLFSDYAVKQRAIYVPPDGRSAAFTADHAFDFPVGSVVMKSFAFPADMRAPTENVQLVETRLMVHYPEGWQGFAYVWDAAQEDAVLSPAGEVRAISFVDGQGQPAHANYLIPQKNQCGNCHARKPDITSAPVMTLLGPSARQLHREGQLERLAEAGFVTGMPPLDSITPAYDFRAVETGGVAVIPPGHIDRAARDYLDANCAHCHNPNGVQGISSQLFLDRANTDLFHLGVCKQPGSAGIGTGGRKYDIVPGNADASVLQFRVSSTEPGAMMPLIGRSLEHARGSELIRTWINAMPATDPPMCGLP